MKKRICILGDSPLVEEFAALCLNKGYTVQARLNASGAVGVRLPKGVKKILRPTKANDFALELTNIERERKKKNLIELDKALPSKTPIFSSSVTFRGGEQATWISHPDRLMGLGALPTLIEGSLVEFAPTQFSDVSVRDAAGRFAQSLGKESEFVQDSVGLVMPRILCMLVNEACFAMGEGVAVPRDIDTAMKLGTNYPHGPLEWAARIGPRHVAAVVSALHIGFGEERYRVAPMLQNAALVNAFRENRV
ncbi:MAG: 3-hydroxybutyryl-CoA dehydrogenase [Ignavibacteriae bacterium]|nr:3-hydroxybutyryl-CoA dehydrogenase [Ignavibacteriota bacterium]